MRSLISKWMKNNLFLSLFRANELVSPQAAQKYRFCLTSLRELINDTLMTCFEVRKKRRIKSTIQWDSNPKLLKCLLPRRALFRCATTAAYPEFFWIYLLRTKNFLPHASVFPDCPRKWKECLRSTARIHFCRNLDNQEMIKNSTKCPREPLIISCRSYFLIFDDFRRSIKEECKN